MRQVEGQGRAECQQHVVKVQVTPPGIVPQKVVCKATNLVHGPEVGDALDVPFGEWPEIVGKPGRYPVQWPRRSDIWSSGHEERQCVAIRIVPRNVIMKEQHQKGETHDPYTSQQRGILAGCISPVALVRPPGPVGGEEREEDMQTVPYLFVQTAVPVSREKVGNLPPRTAVLVLTRRSHYWI